MLGAFFEKRSSAPWELTEAREAQGITAQVWTVLVENAGLIRVGLLTLHLLGPKCELFESSSVQTCVMTCQIASATDLFGPYRVVHLTVFQDISGIFQATLRQATQNPVANAALRTTMATQQVIHPKISKNAQQDHQRKSRFQTIWTMGICLRFSDFPRGVREVREVREVCEVSTTRACVMWTPTRSSQRLRNQQSINEMSELCALYFQFSLPWSQGHEHPSS